MSLRMKVTDVLIIGAGLSGILLSKKLNRESIILEKSRGVGGRISTRRIDGHGFDHGAPYLFNEEAVRDLMPEMQMTDKGLYVNEGMTKIPKSLGQNLIIEKNCRAEFLKFVDRHWVVTSEEGQMFKGNVLVITAPLPQAIELLDKNKIPLDHNLRSIKYSKSVLALLTTETGMKPHFPYQHEVKSVIAMNDRKLHPNGFVIRACDELSEKLYDTSEEECLESLVSLFQSGFSKKQNITYAEIKKWRYALPQKVIESPFAEVNNNLFLIGDAFCHPDIRGPIKSASALAGKLSW